MNRIVQLDGWIFPAAGVVVAKRSNGSLHLAAVRQGWSGSFSGILADAVQRSITTRVVNPVLAGLGPNHPLCGIVAETFGEEPLPLASATAVRLQGIEILFLELLGTCNERCVHCYAEADPNVNDRLDEATCVSILEDAAALNVPRVQFTGGDPLLCPFLPNLVAQARQLGIRHCEIFTNGLLLRPKLLEVLLPHRPSFAFSVYSVDPAIHDAITRTPGSQQKTLRGIRLALAAGLEVRAEVIALEENSPTIPATLEWLRGEGITQIGVSVGHDVGRGHFVTEELPPEAHANSSLGHGNESAGSAVTGRLCVTYRGSVVPCIFNRKQVLGSIHQRRLIDIVRSPDNAPVVFPQSDDDLFRVLREKFQCQSCRITACGLHVLAHA